MAGNKKISQLAASGTLDGTELVPVVKGGVTTQTTAQDIADLGGTSTTPNLQQVTDEGNSTTNAISSPQFSTDGVGVTITDSMIEVLDSTLNNPLFKVERSDDTVKVLGVEVATVNDLSGLLLNSNNLSDVSNKFTSRDNLGLYSKFITTGNQGTTVNTATDITGLSFSATANKRYEIDGKIRFQCSGNGGGKFEITLPSGATMDVILHGFASAGTAYTFSILTASGTLSTAFGNVSGGNPNLWVNFKGEIQMDATAGDVVIGFASGTNGQTTTINQLGTIMKFRQLD